ncbi:hypothetical protein BSKO_13241 [Bryopsis sp. KO-2023]|nr:hypothetical protein BSKO_13241 [Bryopsis sp. KO-2023]
MEGSNTPQDSASQVVGGAEDNNRERSRDERLGETSTYDQRPKDLFVGESPCRIDVSTVSARMLITDRTKGPRNKMNKPTYIYGNYPNYYWVRTEDSRIEAFKKKWFNGLDCLDVGCHEGNFTLEIVKKFRPKSMIGVDIDRTLVLEKARKNRNKTLQSVSQWEEADEESTETKKATMKSLHNTRFFAGDYALKEGAPECMDTITCFSVIKWIHFHHGDDGIKFVFKKIFNALRPGGRFILEPQSWESYAKAKRKQNMFGVPYYNLKLLKLHPSEFLDHLINEVGFKHVKSLAFPDADQGFSRPIFILRKPKHTV